MRLIDADEVVKFYKNMGKEFPELSVGVHFSIADIISNLDNIPTVKRSRKMTMTNAEWMLRKGLMFSKLKWSYINGRNIVYYCKDNRTLNELYAKEDVDPENLITKWLDMEHKEPILDDAEKRYLKAVLKPLPEVNYIQKIYGYNGKENIWIYFKNRDEMYFPWFEKGKMYKGMKTDRKYTIEELGL